MSVKSVFIATHNLGKVREFESLLLPAVRCLNPTVEPFKSIPIPEVKEDGDTYFENALKKAVGYYRTYRIPVLSDDSGLEVDVLGGLPGVNSAHFGGSNQPWPARWRSLTEQLTKFPLDQWKARFRCVLCYFDGVHVPRFYQAAAEGLIVPEPQGGGGFGYDPIFYSPKIKKTFAQASVEEKAKVSHRAIALKQFLSDAVVT